MMSSPTPGSLPDARTGEPVRWGLIGTANIAASTFLPALAEAGGVAVAVGSRDPETAGVWAAEHGVSRASSYADVVHAADVDALYVAVPNDQHAEWATAGCAAGKAVLAEKPLTLGAGQADRLIRETGPTALLWEAFVFPFHPQTQLIGQLVSSGQLGGLCEIVSDFHFMLRRPDNIRMRPERGGGALYDVGCYPIRLARLLFGAEPVRVVAAKAYGGAEVDLDVAAVLDFPGEQRLILSAGMRRSPSTATRIIGTDAELRVSNPFHPLPNDTVELWRGGERQQSWVPGAGTAFAHGIGHVQKVLRGLEAPRHRAVDDAVAQARALDLTHAAAAEEGQR